MNSKIREIIAYEHYFPEFFQSLSKEVQEKFVYLFRLIQTTQRIPEKFLKHIEGSKGLYEMRVMIGSNIYRAFCCFDKGNLVILFNAFQKKSAAADRTKDAVKRNWISRKTYERVL